MVVVAASSLSGGDLAMFLIILCILTICQMVEPMPTTMTPKLIKVMYMIAVSYRVDALTNACRSPIALNNTRCLFSAAAVAVSIVCFLLGVVFLLLLF